MKPENFLDMLLSAIKGTSTDRSKWVRIGRLDKEDTGRYRALVAKADMVKNEIKALEKKAKSLSAQIEADGAEWWVYLKKKYGIPKGNLHLNDDGTIVREPEVKS